MKREDKSTEFRKKFQSSKNKKNMIKYFKIIEYIKLETCLRKK